MSVVKILQGCGMVEEVVNSGEFVRRYYPSDADLPEFLDNGEKWREIVVKINVLDRTASMTRDGEPEYLEYTEYLALVAMPTEYAEVTKALFIDAGFVCDESNPDVLYMDCRKGVLDGYPGVSVKLEYNCAYGKAIIDVRDNREEVSPLYMLIRVRNAVMTEKLTFRNSNAWLCRLAIWCAHYAGR